MSRFKKTLLILAGILTLSGISALQFAPLASAQTSTDAAKQSSCLGLGGTYDTSTGKCSTDSPSLNNIIARVINILSTIIGIVAVIMIMVGGFKYITANGDSGNISSAKTTIVYAIVGLVIVAFAQFMVQFVIEETTTTKTPPPKTTQVHNQLV